MKVSFIPILAYVLWLICINQSLASEIISDDAVIIEAVNDTLREKRHLFFTYAQPIRPFWATRGIGDPCLTSRGVLGSCHTYKECYPFFKDPITKFPNLNAWDYWILGNQDTCNYYTEDGRQAFGVCCTNPIENVQPTELPEVADEQKVEIPTAAQSPFQGSQFGVFGIASWPPPIPTHPPDHTAATHPPHFGFPATTQKPFGGLATTTTKTTTTTTTKPSTTTWATKPPSHFQTTTQRPSFIITTPPENSYNEIFPDSSAGCGAKNGNPDQNRIVGGQNADPLEWPWIAVLFNGGKQFCGGSLLDEYHILSAAHCVAHFTQWDVARLTVRLGDYNIRINTEVKHIERKVKRVVRHKGFDSRTLYNDIAILTLDQKVPFSRGIRPICLPSAASGLFNGKIGTVVGWGSLREMGPQPSILQEVTLPIWRNDECRQKYGPAAPGGIIDSMICAGQAAKGPLVVNNNGRWTQAGIVSWGIGCGKGQYPGVYTRVTSFLPWIEKNTKDV